MADDADLTTSAPTDATTLLSSISSAIALAQTSGAIANKVVDGFAQIEINRRVDLLTKGINKMQELEKLYNGINKPDGKQFSSADQDATVTETFSEKRRQEIAKSKKNLTDVANALGKALNGEYDALEKALKGGGKPAAPADGDED